MRKVDSQSAKFEFYRRGVLSWKLDPLQKELHKTLLTSPDKIQVLLCSRRIGKSYLAAVLAIEQCLKKPNSIVKVLAPTKLMINTILRPLIKQILEDCPDDFKPELLKSQYIYYFPNGSEIHLSGSDGGHAEKLRGGFSDLCIVDEAGFCTDLINTVRSILIPTTMNTKGKILLLSTPPKSPDHELMSFVEEAEKNNTLLKKTIYDNPRIKPEEISEIIAAYPGGANDPEFKREFLCVLTKDISTAVIPEFTEELEKEIVKDWPLPPFFDSYVGMDLGYDDLTALVFGYYDFRAGKVIIEDELVVDFKQPNMTIPKLIEMIRAKEAALWTNKISGEIKKPFLRISDINPIVLNEISKSSNGEINFAVPHKKDDKDVASHELRLMLASKKIIIHPRCENLIKHLRNVKWASAINHKTFARSAAYAHFDFVDALIYMVRVISYNRNPYPNHYNYNLKDLHITNPQVFQNNSEIKINQIEAPSQVEMYRKMFNLPRKRI